MVFMNNQKKIIAIGIVLIVLIVLSMVYLLFPKISISLNGDKSGNPNSQKSCKAKISNYSEYQTRKMR